MPNSRILRRRHPARRDPAGWRRILRTAFSADAFFSMDFLSFRNQASSIRSSVQFVQTNPADPQQLFAKPVKGEFGQAQRRQKRIFNDFMRRHVKHRNRGPERSVPPFLLPSPALHNRHLTAPNLYRDQAPIVAIQLRCVEILYSGSKLYRMRDEIVHTVRIPHGH